MSQELSNQMSLETEQIRKFLMKRFDDETLDAFCSDHFREVYQQFAIGMSKGQKVQRLLDYSERQDQWVKLHAKLKQLYPELYGKHFPDSENSPLEIQTNTNFKGIKIGELSLLGCLIRDFMIALSVLLVFIIGSVAWSFITDPVFIGASPSATPTSTKGVPTPIGDPATTTAIAIAVSDTPTPIPIGDPTTTTETATLGIDTPTPTLDRDPETLAIGQSVSGQSIEAIRIGGGENVIILIGGLHAGFAPATVAIAEEAITYFTEDLDRVPFSVTLYIIPNANPDSQLDPGELAGRLNANDVDLSRNWDCDWVEDPPWRNVPATGTGGTQPFSEPETIALRDFILAQDPEAVIFWEARASGGLSAPGACDPNSQVSVNLAITYGRASGYRVTDFETLTSQELNGDSTNWLDQQGIPAIAILLPDYDDMDWNRNLAGLRAVLDQYDK